MVSWGKKIRKMSRRKYLYVSFFFVFPSFVMTFLVAGYSFFDSAEVALLGRKKSPFSKVGE